LATIKRYVKHRREVGHVKPKAIPGRPAKKARQREAALLPQLQAHPDVTLEHHCELWQQAHGERVSPRTMGRAIKQLGWTRKKSRWQPVNATSKSEPVGASR
jgi:transposase